MDEVINGFGGYLAPMGIETPFWLFALKATMALIVLFAIIGGGGILINEVAKRLNN